MRGYDDWKLATPPEYEEANDDECDGLHDEGAPAHYLCTRCYPDGIDEPHPEQDLHDEDLARGESDYEDRP